MPTERDVFDDLLRGNRQNAIEEVLAMGVFHYYKWDRILSWEEENQCDINHATYIAITNGFTSQEVDLYRSIAAQSIRNELERRFSLEVAESVSSRLQTGWWSGFWQSFAAAFGYSVALLIVFLIVSWLGVDLSKALRLE